MKAVLFNFIATFILLASAFAQTPSTETPLLSPIIADLKQRVATDRPKAVDEFWAMIRSKGAPLVEPLKDSTDSSILTFIYRGKETELKSVRIDSSLNALLVNGIEPDFERLGYFERLPETDIWYLSFRVRNDLRTVYSLIPKYANNSEPKPQIDPMNPNIFAKGVDGHEVSAIELSAAVPQPWVKDKATEPKGSWENSKLQSTALGSERNVWVYKPINYKAENVKPYDLVICFDAVEFGKVMPTRLITENLIAAGKIPPTIVVLIDDVDAKAEHDEYLSVTKFVAEELVPNLRKKYNLTKDPSKTVIAGSSRRGLVSALVAYRRPEVFGNVLSMSGSFFWKPETTSEYEWLATQIASNPNKSLNIYLSAGLLENVVTPRNHGHYMLSVNRHLRDVLQAKQYKLKYEEFSGGHEELNWQGSFADGLIYLLGGQK